MNRAIHSPLFGEVIVPLGAGMFVFGLGGSRSLITWGVAWIFAGGFIAFFGWRRRRATRIAQSGPSNDAWPPDFPSPDASHSIDSSEGFSSVGDGGADVH
jgi:hypothetical protein